MNVSHMHEMQFAVPGPSQNYREIISLHLKADFNYTTFLSQSFTREIIYCNYIPDLVLVT